jgi:hypothetical protein
MTDIKLDIPDIGVVVSRPDVSVDPTQIPATTVVLTPGDTYITNLHIPHTVAIESDNYLRVADVALTASYVSGGAITDWTDVQNKPMGLVSESTQVVEYTNGQDITPSTVSSSFAGNLFGTASFATSASYAPTILPSGVVSSSLQISYPDLQNIPDGIISSSTQVTVLLPSGTVSSSTQIDHNATTNYVINQHIDHSTVSMSAGLGITGGGDLTTSRTLALDTGSTHFTQGVKVLLDTDGVVSSSAQVSYTEISDVPAGIISSSTQFVDSTAPFTGSFSGSLLGTASYATNSDLLDGLDSSVFATTGSNIFLGDQVVTGVVETSALTLQVPSAQITITGSTLLGVFNETVIIDPPIAATVFSGAVIDYNAQRVGASRFGTVMASWSGSEIVFTDNSTNDVGETWDLSFNLIRIDDEIRLRAYSLGSGSATWNIGVTITLFPNLL